LDLLVILIICVAYFSKKGIFMAPPIYTLVSSTVNRIVFAQTKEGSANQQCSIEL
jgi:hypothetical protein